MHVRNHLNYAAAATLVVSLSFLLIACAVEKPGEKPASSEPPIPAQDRVSTPATTLTQSPVPDNVITNYNLTPEMNGIDGQLRLIAAKPSSANDRDTESKPDATPAEIAVISRNGDMLFREALRASRATLKPVTALRFKPQWFAVEEDLGAGFGSYSGLETSFIRVRNRKVEWASIPDSTGAPQRIIVLSSLKTAWWLDPRSDNQSASILEKACRPTEPDSFRIIWIRYRFDGVSWKRSQRSADGFWENEDPKAGLVLSEFPR